MNQIAKLPPTTQANNIRTKLELLANKYQAAREHRYASEIREIAKDARLLEESLRGTPCG